jgi:SNF2 family DNA or RNA helicase
MKLIKLLRPVILQRKKCEHETALELPQKSEYVIWVQLSSAQLQIYEQILKSRSFIAAMNRTKLPLESINVLKSLCRSLT